MYISWPEFPPGDREVLPVNSELMFPTAIGAWTKSRIILTDIYFTIAVSFWDGGVGLLLAQQVEEVASRTRECSDESLPNTMGNTSCRYFSMKNARNSRLFDVTSQNAPNRVGVSWWHGTSKGGIDNHQKGCSHEIWGKSEEVQIRRSLEVYSVASNQKPSQVRSKLYSVLLGQEGSWCIVFDLCVNMSDTQMDQSRVATSRDHVIWYNH